jgi:hypothetical protein
MAQQLLPVQFRNAPHKHNFTSDALKNFDITFASVSREPALHRLITFQVPNLMSIFLNLDRLSEISFQVRDP